MGDGWGADGTRAADANLAHILTEWGLTRRESTVLLALLRLGSATVAQVARAAGLERANVYGVLEGLAGHGLIEALPDAPQRWSCPAGTEIVDRLVDRHNQRHRELLATGEALRHMLGTVTREAPPVELPCLRLIGSPREVSRIYDQLLAGVRSELLVGNQGPYGGRALVRPAVISALARGVVARALYEAFELDALEARELRQTRVAYHEAGVEGRVVDRLPMRLAVFDRRAVLFAMTDPLAPQRFPVNVLVEHGGFGEFAAASFERMWSTASRYPRPRAAPAGRSSPAAGQPPRVMGEQRP